MNRGAVGHVLFFALVDRELRRWPKVFIVGFELELELQRFAEVFDRRDVAERFGEALVEEPLETLALHRDQIRQLQRLGQVGERITLAGRGSRSHNYSLAAGGEAANSRSGARKVKWA
jgi:hypothetical protein